MNGKPRKTYDLCVLWNWEYDYDFVTLLAQFCLSQSHTVLQVTPQELNKLSNDLEKGKLGFRVFLDRASEDDEQFMPFVRWACEKGGYYINPYERARRSWDKAAMHYPFINAGLYTPHSIILPAFTEQPNIPPLNLSELGDRFIIKPANGSGGEGVITDATTWEEVIVHRTDHPQNRYLLQTFILPQILDNRHAWFRVLYCRGQVYPCWWNTETHIYAPVSPVDIEQYSLGALYEITTKIAEICGLDIFSTEIAFTPDNLFIVIDYVNDQPDLRFQSKAIDGVPDEIVQNIALRLSEIVGIRTRV